MSIPSLFVVVLKGAAMGVAEIIPGVSGGTIALLVGIYDRLVTAIASLRPAPLRHVPRLHRRRYRRTFIAELADMDVHFLFALGVGMLAMVVTLARVIEHILETYPGITYSFFGGLILASAIVLYRYVDVNTPERLMLALVVIVVAFVLSGIATATMGHTLPVLFVAGAIAITALVLPGVSGSFLLLAMGQYEHMLGVLNDFVNALTSASMGEIIETAPPVFAFLSGAVVGLLTVSHAVSYALERAREVTLIALISLMVGALRVPGESVIDAYQPSVGWILAVCLAGLIGAMAILVFDHVTDDLEY